MMHAMILEQVMTYLNDIKRVNLSAIENEARRVRDDEEARYARAHAAGLLGVVGLVRNMTSEPAEINATLVRFCERRIEGIAMSMWELQMGNTEPAENILIDAVNGGAQMLKMMAAFNDSPDEWSDIRAQVRKNFELLKGLNAGRAVEVLERGKDLQSIVGR